MKVYLHDIILHFSKVSSKDTLVFDSTLKSKEDYESNDLIGNVLAHIQTTKQLNEILSFLESKNPKNLKSITFNWDDKNAIKKYLKGRYHYIKAAGGLATKAGMYLFIFRLKKWDLPKGKLEKGEEILECALREVEEECSVKVVEGPKIGSTWHLYPTKNGWCVKKSTWFMMECTDDSEMKPQYQEDIEEITWVAPENVEKYLANSYGTIHDVFAKARKKGLIK